MFDAALKVDYNADHIHRENPPRIKRCLRGEDHPRAIEEWLSAELRRQLNAAKYSHRLCTPQYFPTR
jgi:hypothetical protein